MPQATPSSPAPPSAEIKKPQAAKKAGVPTPGIRQAGDPPTYSDQNPAGAGSTWVPLPCCLLVTAVGRMIMCIVMMVSGLISPMVVR